MAEEDTEANGAAAQPQMRMNILAKCIRDLSFENGVAQKGGAVKIQCRLAERPDDIAAIRVATGECDALIGGDLVVSAGAKTLGLTKRGRTGAVVNSHEIITGDFTRFRDFQVPSDRLKVSLQARLQDRVAFFDANDLALRMLGDSIYSNMLVLGACWQRGLIPLQLDTIMQAFRLNGAKVEENQRAFQIGRWAMAFPRTDPQTGDRHGLADRSRGLARRTAGRVPGQAAGQAVRQTGSGSARADARRCRGKLLQAVGL